MNAGGNRRVPTLHWAQRFTKRHELNKRVMKQKKCHQVEFSKDVIMRRGDNNPNISQVFFSRPYHICSLWNRLGASFLPIVFQTIISCMGFCWKFVEFMGLWDIWFGLHGVECVFPMGFAGFSSICHRKKASDFMRDWQCVMPYVYSGYRLLSINWYRIIYTTTDWTWFLQSFDQISNQFIVAYFNVAYENSLHMTGSKIHKNNFVFALKAAIGTAFSTKVVSDAFRITCIFPTSIGILDLHYDIALRSH